MQQPQPLRLGINIDHVATLRNARGGSHPDPLRAAVQAIQAGADSITVHLREDRRHIRDHDVEYLTTNSLVPLNLEMAATEEMVTLAYRYRPHACCLVPERRAELTTEGGLDVVSQRAHLLPIIESLETEGIITSLFVDPDLAQIDAAYELKASAVEFHTGPYCHTEVSTQQDQELERLIMAATHAEVLGLECHAGHGLSFDNVGKIAEIPAIVELNIGHFLIGEALFNGLYDTIKRMRTIIDDARATLLPR